MKKRIIPIMLVLVLLVQILTTYVFAENDTSKTSLVEAVETETGETRKAVVVEMTDRRSESEKHFRLNDGSFIAVDYGAPVYSTAAQGTGGTEDGSTPLKKSVGYRESGRDNTITNSVTKEEKNVISNMLAQYGIDGKKPAICALRDANNLDKYLIAKTDNGYLIIDRDGFQFCQCGDKNPYEGFENQICYYGGPLCYYVLMDEQRDGSDSAKYYDIVQNTTTNNMITLSRCNNEELRIERDDPKRSVDLNPVTLPNNFEFIRRIAFGYNDDSTCSAVATGIAISYLALNENMRIISDNHIPEAISDVNMNPGDAAIYGNYKGKITTLHPNAYALHRYIAENANMGPVNFGLEVDDAIGDYIELINASYPVSEFYQLDSSWTISPSASTIRKNISSGKPVLITTTVSGGLYNWHTMCVYGHQRIDDTDSLLVHTGWWYNNEAPQFVETSPGVYAKEKLWINESWATFGHYFSYENPLKTYVDIPPFTEYTYDGILYCVKNGIMAGTKVLSYFPGTNTPSQIKFSPDGILNRAQMVQIMYAHAGKPSVSGYNNPFVDVSSTSYYYNAVRWAYHYGIVAGTNSTHFSPNNQLTREQLGLMLYRYAEFIGKDTSHRLASIRIKDWNQVSTWAADSFRWAAFYHILAYTNDGGRLYRPLAPATRAETAYAMHVLCEQCD